MLLGVIQGDIACPHPFKGSGVRRRSGRDMDPVSQLSAVTTAGRLGDAGSTGVRIGGTVATPAPQGGHAQGASHRPDQAPPAIRRIRRPPAPQLRARAGAASHRGLPWE